MCQRSKRSETDARSHLDFIVLVFFTVKKSTMSWHHPKLIIFRE